MTDSGCPAGEGARRPSEGGGVGGSQRVPTRRPERACGQRSAARRAGTRCPDEAALHVPARPASSSPPGTRQVSGRVSGQALKQARAAVLSPSEEAPETRRELGVTAPAAHPAGWTWPDAGSWAEGAGRPCRWRPGRGPAATGVPEAFGHVRGRAFPGEATVPGAWAESKRF